MCVCGVPVNSAEIKVNPSLLIYLRQLLKKHVTEKSKLKPRLCIGPGPATVWACTTRVRHHVETSGNGCDAFKDAGSHSAAA